MSENFYTSKTYYAIALDPIHVGAGAALLGRVDLPIIRDPGTNIPKIPGTSLSGPARTYTAIKTGKYKWKDSDGEYSCAGRGGDWGEKHCGKVSPACPVCVPYGFSKGSGNSMQGLTQFFDAQILLFPVSSMAGPVWITSPMSLQNLKLETEFQAPENSFYPFGRELQNKEMLNLGWLLLKKGQGNGSLNQLPIPEEIKQRAVLISDKLFPKVINSNLEVRTSVSIDPATGTAEEGALYTYEAIPRGTVLMFDVIYNSGNYFKIGDKKLEREGGLDVDTSWVRTQVEIGLQLFGILGIGGMGTRGMGRLKILNLEMGDC